MIGSIIKAIIPAIKNGEKNRANLQINNSNNIVPIKTPILINTIGNLFFEII